MCLVMGWDMLAYFPQWHEPLAIIATVDEIVAVRRPGFVAEPDAVERLSDQLPGLAQKVRVLEAPQLDIAASALRARVASGLPIRYLVPNAVRRYIEQHGLYAANPGPRARSVRTGEETTR